MILQVPLFVTASFREGNSFSNSVIVGQTVNENDDPFILNIGETQSGILKELATGSHDLIGSIGITNALGESINVDADLTLIGFHEGMMKSENNSEIFEGYDKIGNILFVNTLTSKSIK